MGGVVAMKKLLAALVGAGALALLVSGPAAAGPELPWCVTRDNGVFIDCSFYTLRQCVVTARGVGHCIRNGRFDFEYYLRGQVAPDDLDPYARTPRKRHRR
jgi:hypothetical protein